MAIKKYSEMTKEELVQYQAEIEDLLERASHLYYNTDEKLLSDTEFDQLKDLYEENFGDFRVGALPTEGKGTVDVEHSFGHLVGTLSKTNSIEEFREWLTKTVINAGYDVNKRIRVIASYKYDGNSVVIEFKNGKCHKALTRGRDGKGLDLTHVFKDVTIEDKRHIGVKFEVIMRYEDFDQLNEDMGCTYKNPRSVTAGILGRDDAYDYFKYLTLVPLACDVKGEKIKKNEELELILEQFRGKPWSKETLAFDIFDGTVDEVVEQLDEFYKETAEDRQILPFMIDGIVIELIGKKFRDLGWVNSKPKWSCALKFPYMEATSKVTGFDFCLGNSGKITPRVWFEPVKFNGATQTKVSLSNYDRFQELKLGIGSDVLVQYRNDTLSYVEKLDTEHNKTVDPYPFTETCPVCGGSVVISDTGAFALCGNSACPGKVVGRVERYLTKLDIKGIKAATLEKLHENGMLNRISDLYKLDYNKVAKLEGLGTKSASLMKKAIEGKVPYDYELLAGIGIEDFGNTMAKELSKVYTIEELYSFIDSNNFYTKLINLEGFSDITINKLEQGLKLYKFELLYIKERTQAKVYKDTIAKPVGQTFTFCVTGSLNQFMNRDELKQILESLGHKVIGGVTSKTDYLINNDVASTSGKNKKAKELGKPIINEEQLKELLGL